MIVDTLAHSGRYAALHPAFAAALAFLQRHDLTELTPGRYDIDGDRAYALVQRGPGRPRLGACLEAHRAYIDIQYVVSGCDTMGWRSTSDCEAVEAPYSGEKDVALYADEPEAWVAVGPGRLAIFWPEDAHMPMLAEGELHKVVVKVAL
jgi:biofilm protein TabA